LYNGAGDAEDLVVQAYEKEFLERRSNDRQAGWLAIPLESAAHFHNDVPHDAP
jgi:hypothetical protein